MKMYCSECGTPHGYVGKKPNFCTNCGFSFAGMEKPSTARVEEVEEDQDNIEEIPNISGLEVEIEPYQNNSIKLGEAVDYNQTQASQPTARNKGKRLTKKAEKEFLNNWQKEAGTSRKRNE